MNFPRRLFLTPLPLLMVSAALAADLPKPMVTGLKNPESVCIGADGLPYVSEIGEFGKDGDGKVTVIKEGKAVPFASGLDDPKGIVTFQNAFYVADKTKVVKIDADGKVSTFVAADKFPLKTQFLNDVALDPESGSIYVSDSGDLMGAGGAVFKIDLKTAKATTVIDSSTYKDLKTPNGLALDGASHLLVLDFGSGALLRVKLADKKVQVVVKEGFEGGDGLVWDKFGQLFITSWKQGKLWGIPRPGQEPVLISDKFEQGSADFCVANDGRTLLIPHMLKGTLTAVPNTIPGWEVDTSPLPVGLEVAFPKLQWTGWEPVTEAGLINPLRPILLTHPGDGSNRVVVPTQQGVVHIFENDNNATKTSILLDITDRVRYSDKQNEEGLLGLAFHPKFKTNGEIYVFYTDVKAKMANVVSRFRMSKDDPSKADPKSEEEIIRFEKPYWNHDGGTIAFGPDGYLYITHGDGGAGNDPHENGQNLNVLLGKVLRLDVDRKDGGKNYAIPRDNPFVGRKETKEEIFAYGLRNIWRMAFDRKTGELWAGEVGQNLYEEINIITPGGNYGWSLRESFHPFGAKGIDVTKGVTEPLWEYHHDIGKSITGGHVYRGTQVPELDGAYLYADYVSAKVWALRYDKEKKRVVANHEIKGPGVPVLSFGEDGKGESYLMTHSQNGKGLYRFVKSTKND